VGVLGGSVLGFAACGQVNDLEPSDASPGDSGGDSSELTSGGGGEQAGDTGRGGALGASGGAAGAPEESGALGEGCLADSDCEPPLTCYYTPAPYIGDRQCSAPCVADSDCTGQFGEGSACSASKQCVVTCDEAADCPELTLCNDQHWCQRTGPGSGIPYCQGAEGGCSRLPQDQCASALGCTDTSLCDGNASGCLTLSYSLYACVGQDGCIWLNDQSVCTGTATKCDAITSEAQCKKQQKCAWNSECSGTRTPCSDTPLALCSDQPGCSIASPPECTPSEVTCNPDAEEVIECAPDGLSHTVVEDCAASDEVCVGAKCKPVICSPGDLACMDNAVRECSVKGDKWAVEDDCSSAEFCNEDTVSCEKLFCLPDTESCDDNTAVLCDSTGHAYVSAGTDCTPDYCFDGECASPIFQENFEDGDFNGWTVGTGAYTNEVIDTTAANGSGFSLSVTQSGPPSEDNLSYSFEDIQPRAMSFWMRAGGSGGTLALSSNHGTQELAAYIYFSVSETINLNSYLGIISVPYVSDNWYHIEFRNMNWQTQKLDYYVDGVLVQDDAAMSGSQPPTSMNRIDIVSYGQSYWDEITLY
jgi:hypothetical protein